MSRSDSTVAVRRHYDAIAERYDARWEEWVERTVRETLVRVDLEGVGSILDVGCGTGTLLAALVRKGGDRRLVGLDASPGMLARGREKLGRTAGWVAADALSLPFADGVFDLAVSLSALHHWTDPAAALDEIRRVVRPGGRVAITDWCGDAWTVRARDLALRVVRASHGRVRRAAELEDLLAAAGFRWIRVERWRLDWSWEIMTGVAARPDGG